ncbi:circularly permuted type 2 ATP-grasp protein [Euzebya tangerina]|uniref:circularly permuted type 2 ATP-grasp protein n=1 Tax=Euzebya tangerina TaxID=591198 RepID=UPI000E317C5B|nr:circularly permuted type 2 ATP-grasp protein [Euzebya tangerina]
MSTVAYAPPQVGHDEMLAPDGSIRPPWEHLGRALADLSIGELRARRAEAARLLDDDGVTYHVPRTGERLRWQLDPLPLLIDASEWAEIESGVVQRAELLNLILTDLYGPRRLLEEGLIPPVLVLDHPGYLRQQSDVRLPGSYQLFSYAVDLARDASGAMVVLGDRTQAPSGAAYALQNRVVTSRVFPKLHRQSQVQRLAPYFRALRQGLAEVAPAQTRLPRTVLLTPGSRNETAFEHAFLAARLGLSLVEGSDLVVRDGRVWLRSLGNLEAVDVILRRMDAEWCDPLELRPDSLIGVPGLGQAVRSGRVSVVNTLGSGVLENPALQAYLPTIAQRVLGQSLRLPAPRSLWCGDSAHRAEALAEPSEWVFRRTSRQHATDAPLVGALLDERQLLALRAAIAAAPHRWVAQERRPLATAPSLTDIGVVPRQSVLRTFAVADGAGYTVMPGGLTRVASGDDGVTTDAITSDFAAALSKDTWVLAGKPETLTGFWIAPESDDLEIPAAGMPARAAENLFWLGRYAERAEGVARLLREVEDRRTEFNDAVDGPGIAGIHGLLQALTQITTTYPGFIGEGGQERLADPDDELEMIASDETRPGTLADAISKLLDCVDAVRDQLSGDTWLVVTDLQRRVRPADPADRSGFAVGGLTGTPSGDIAQILHGLLAIQGLGAENMLRDVGWHFMDAGRRLERALQVIALLRATTTYVRDTPADSLMLESVLRVSESIITYRRRYRSRGQVGTLLDLLLVDPDNPRSLTYQIDRLATDLRALPGHPGSGRIGAAERGVLEASTALRVADTRSLATGVDGALRAELDEFLAHLYNLLVVTGEQISATYFVHQKPQRTLLAGEDVPSVDGSG